MSLKESIAEMLTRREGGQAQPAPQQSQQQSEPVATPQQPPAAEPVAEPAAEPAALTAEQERENLKQLALDIANIARESAQAQPQVEPQQPQAEPQQEPAPQVMQFFNPDAINEALGDEENGHVKLADMFNKALTAVHTSARKEAAREIMNSTKQYVEKMVGIYSTTSDFFRAHPQLAAMEPIMAVLVEGIQKAHPDWGYRQLLEEAAKQLESKIRMEGGGNAQAQAQQPVVQTETPAFPGGVNARPPGAFMPAGADNSIEGQIAEMRKKRFGR